MKLCQDLCFGWQLGSRKPADAPLSILIEWPPCYWSHVEWSRRCARGFETTRAVGDSADCTTFGTTTRRLAHQMVVKSGGLKRLQSSSSLDRTGPMPET